MFQSRKLLDKLFEKQKNGNNHMILNHSDKIWIMPSCNINIGLNLYQPSTLKGRILKRCLYIFKNSEFLLKKMGAKRESLLLNSEIKKYLSQVLDIEDFFVAAYMGDASSKQNDKVTLQIYNNREIIAYAKVTMNEEVKGNFQAEIQALKFLEEKKIQHIPQIPASTDINGMMIFVQTTQKPLNQKVSLAFGKEHISFIDDIVRKTRKEMQYESTNFYQYIQYLKGVMEQFNITQREVLQETIDKIESYLKKGTHEYAFSHGDYTPWNVYYTGNDINLFDFEYCSDAMPCYIDVFHYLTQMSLLGYRNDVDKTIKIYKKHEKLLEKFIKDTKFTYLCYLIYIISFYKKRTEEEAENIQEKYSQWIDIIKGLD